MPNKIQFITGVPGQTRGDLFSAKKLIDQLAKKDVEIEWIIVRDDNSLKNLEVPSNVSVKYVDSWQNIKNIDSTDNDFYMIYPYLPPDLPDYLEVRPEVKEYLKTLPRDKVLLTCTEYNAHARNIKIHSSLQYYYPIVQRLDTGFGNLGVFLDSANSGENLLKNFQDNEPKLVEKLFSNRSESDYFFRTHLYFGYYNVYFEKESHPNNKIDRVNYAVICIRDALHEYKVNGNHKNIDIVINLDANSDLLKAILDKLTIEERKLLGEIEYIAENNSIRLANESSESDRIHLRIINPFPMSHAAMLYLIAKSNPLTMLTGDQSFSEGLMNSKLIFYHLMAWKTNFYDAFLQEIKNFSDVNNLGGEQAVLYQFYALQKESISKNQFSDQVLKFYHMNKEELLQQQMMFTQYIQQHSNLYTQFVPKIMETLLHMNHLLKASALGDLHAIEEYLKINKSVDDPRDTYGNTALMLAAKNQELQSMQILIKAGASFSARNSEGDTPLMIAIKSKSLNSVTFLLDNNAQLSKEALYCAVENNAIEIVSMFFDRFPNNVLALLANHDDGELSLLHLAAKRRYPEMVNLLMDRGFNVNQKDGNGKTPLETWLESIRGFYSSGAFDLQIPKLLIQRGAILDEDLFNKVLNFKLSQNESIAWKDLKNFLSDVIKKQRIDKILESPDALRKYLRETINQASIHRYLPENENTKAAGGVLNFFNRKTEKKREVNLRKLANDPSADVNEIIRNLKDILFNSKSDYNKHPLRSTLEKLFDTHFLEYLRKFDDRQIAKISVSSSNSLKR